MEQVDGIPRYFGEDDFDLSSLSYPQFLDFFFDRPIVGDAKQYDLFRGGIDRFTASKPATVVAHVQAMCREYSDLNKVHSHEELNQGLWAIFGPGISCEQYLFDPTVDLGLRIECIESMYLPFRDVVASSAIGKRDSFYWMWWDMILHTFWITFRETDDHCEALSNDARQIFESMYQTLLKILVLDHPACQWRLSMDWDISVTPWVGKRYKTTWTRMGMNLPTKTSNGLKRVVTAKSRK
jgi:hypothetical protein